MWTDIDIQLGLNRIWHTHDVSVILQITAWIRIRGIFDAKYGYKRVIERQRIDELWKEFYPKECSNAGFV